MQEHYECQDEHQEHFEDQDEHQDLFLKSFQKDFWKFWKNKGKNEKYLIMKKILKR